MQIESEPCHQQTKSPVMMDNPVPSSSNGDQILPDFGGFLDTGRTGRRNAIPDIHVDSSANVSTADLPLDFEKLTCSNS